MNLIKAGHTHTFSNMNSETPVNIASAPYPFTECPLGHSDCVVNHTSTVTYNINNTTRTVSKNLNICSKSHQHALQKKGYSSANVTNIVLGEIQDCDAAHTHCADLTTYYYDALRLTISGLVSGNSSSFTITNLIKMSSHTHSVSNALTDKTFYNLAIRVFEECALGHSNCLMMNTNALNGVSYASTTTSGGVV